MASPRFSDFLIWVGKALTNTQWNANLQTIINYLTDDYDVSFGSVEASSMDVSGTVTAGSFSGDGSDLTNLPSASSSSYPYRLVGGLSKASGYPNFLTVTSTDRSVTLSASTTNVFTAVINGTTVEISTSLVISGLTVAPSSNNTCTISTAILYNGSTYTKTEGEYGDTAINIQSIGTSISALNGTVQGFKVGSTEYFQAFVNTTSSLLQNITRGDGDGNRLALSTNNTITLQNINYIFLDSSATLYASTTYPKRVPTAPTATLNAYYFNTSTKSWYFCGDGANWAITNRILLGRVYCDTTSSRMVQCEDWDTTSWTNYNQTAIEYLSTNSVRVRVGSVDISTTRIIGDFSNGTNLVLSTSNIAETVSVVSTNTLYHMYLKNPDATPIYSTVSPRQKYYNGRGQYLHPTDYWRWIGWVYNDSTSQIVHFRQDGGDYEYHTGAVANGDSSAVLPGSAAISTTSSTIEFKTSPPQASSVDFQVTTASIANLYTYDRGDANGMGILRTDVTSQPTPTMRMQNSTAQLRAGDTGTAAPYKLRFNP